MTFNEKEKFVDFFKTTFKDAQKEASLIVKEGEKRFDVFKREFWKNFDNFFEKDEKGNIKWDKVFNKIKDKIESVFKEFTLEIGVGGSCEMEKNKVKKCSLMINFCIPLFNLKLEAFVFPIKFCPYIECAISIIPFVKSEICVGFGPNFDLENSDNNSFDIDINGGASVGITLDFGIYFPSLSSPIRLSFNVGLTGILGSGKIGIKLSLFFKDKFIVDLYAEFKAFELSFYVMFTLSFNLDLGVIKLKFSFSFYIYKKLFGGFLYSYHNERSYKYKKTKRLKHEIKYTKNGNRWAKKKENKVITEEYSLL